MHWSDRMEEDFELEFTEEEKKLFVDPVIKEVADKPRVLLGNPLAPGCGSLLAFKLALQVLDDCIVVNSSGCITLLTDQKGSYLSKPMLHWENAASAASGICRAIKNEKKAPLVLAFSGDLASLQNIESILAAAKRNENMIYICCNNQGGCSINTEPREKSIASLLNKTDAYVATACVAYPDDYIKKLKKAKQLQGFRLIEVLCPCPAYWGFDPSHTVEVGRTAVDTGFWPLYEIENKKMKTTMQPSKQPVSRYTESQKRYRNITEEKMKELKETTDKNLEIFKK